MSTELQRWSHSRWNEYNQCGHRYYLRRVLKVPEQPSLSAVAGRAVHRWTELYDLGVLDGRDLEEAWKECFEDAIQHEEHESGLPASQFRVSGRRSKAAPDRENLTWWVVEGWQMCQRYVEWRQGQTLVPVDDLPPDPNGRTVGIEYRVEVTLPTTGQPYVAVIDRIFTDGYGNKLIVDIKTGKLRHEAQLPQNAAALSLLGVGVHAGAYYEARKGEMTEPFPLDWSADDLAWVISQAEDSRSRNVFPVRVGDHCAWCPVSAHCRFHHLRVGRG